MPPDSYNARSRIWIINSKGTFLGNGRVQLLQAIQKHGSISKAAKALNMSYVKAWRLVNDMNSSSDKPLVVRSSGGEGGGGTVLTTHGEEAMKKFDGLSKRCEVFVDKELKKIKW